MRQGCFVLLAFLCALALSCSPQTSPGAEDGGPGGGDLSAGGTADGAACVNLQCRIADCRGRGIGTTTVSGVVNTPAGNLPLYDAWVYVPNSTVPAIVNGPSCDRCDAQLAGNPVTSTKTDANGRFVLKNVPSGMDIPLVISLGKWRRQITLPSVQACADTPIDAAQTRLPKNRSEGDIPRIALTTGGYDALECLLRKIGLDDAEFTPETGTGRVNLFAGHGGTSAYKPPLNNGASFTVAPDAPGTSSGWWSSLDHLKNYDILMLSCEGGQRLDEKSATARKALQDYIDAGGHVFASHWQNVWIVDGPAPLSTIGTFYPFSQGLEFQTVTAQIDTSFPRGQALADWLVNVGASVPRGTLQVLNARSTVMSISPSLTQRYVYYDDPMRGMPDAQYFTFNAPVGAAAGQQCGRMVFTDMHASGNDADHPTPGLDYSSPGAPFPTGCLTKDLTAQEKALIFLLFELSNCVQPILG